MVPVVENSSAILIEAAENDFAARYQTIRQATEQLCASLTAEDCVVQSMPNCSPVKWHLAHTSWFFETFVLERALRNFTPFHPQFRVLFNSYYQSVGEQYARPQRGLLTRPSLGEARAYRQYVDEQMIALLNEPDRISSELAAIIELGCNHEQQHQELILTDIKHLFFFNPLRPIYRAVEMTTTASAPPLRWLSFNEALREVGHAGNDFAFDNETPRHRVFLEAFQLASRCVTNREYLDFINDDGYARPEFWLSDGWDAVNNFNWRAPLYWQRNNGAWFTHTLTGYRELNLDEPVTHISFYEADAYARWAGARLPSEFEWEVAAELQTLQPQSSQSQINLSVNSVSSVANFSEPHLTGNFVESGRLHPAPALDSLTLAQMFGDVWEWTRSPYSPYPGFRAAAGALGEYNGKFMCNQMVLRGGSCVTPQSHIRASYRNFFPPDARWQFSGLRLARDI